MIRAWEPEQSAFKRLSVSGKIEHSLMFETKSQEVGFLREWSVFPSTDLPVGALVIMMSETAGCGFPSYFTVSPPRYTTTQPKCISRWRVNSWEELLELAWLIYSCHCYVCVVKGRQVDDFMALFPSNENGRLTTRTISSR